MGFKPRKRVVYFAHSMKTYGGFAQVAAAGIQAAFPGTRLWNSEDLDWNALVGRLGSNAAVYRHVIESSDIVVAVPYQGYVGKGVYTEVELALDMRKPTYVFQYGLVAPIKGLRLVDPNDWAVRYGRLVL